MPASVSKGTIFKIVSTATGTLTAVASTKKFTRGAGSFVDDGFLVGMTITTTITGNSGTFTITAVSALEITVSETVVDAAAAAKVITAKTAVGKVRSGSDIGMTAGEIDATHLDSDVKEYLKDISDGGSVTLDILEDASDVGQKVARFAQASTSGFACEVAYASGAVDTFTALVLGYKSAFGVGAPLTGSITLKINSLVTRA